MAAVDRRRANVNWHLLTENGSQYAPDSYAMVQAALLMDIRAELEKLNALLHCQNFVGIPSTLRGIRRAMPVRRKAKK